MEQAKNKLDEMLQQDEDFFKENFLFVANEANELVASAGLWTGKDFDGNRLVCITYLLIQTSSIMELRMR